MSDSSFDSPGAIKSFLGGIGNAELSVSKEQRYAWIARTLKRTRYFGLTKRDKSVVRAYLKRGSGYSHSQLTRLISQYKARGWLSARAPVKSTFPKKYTNEDILLLAKTDEAHQQLSGSATKKLFERAYKVFGDEAYARLSAISVSHLYNLRNSTFYLRQRRHFSKTCVFRSPRSKVPKSRDRWFRAVAITGSAPRDRSEATIPHLI